MTTRATAWTDPPTSEDDLISWFHEMRDRAPVQEQPGQGDWHVFGYDEARAVLANHAAFSSAYSAALLPPDSPFMLFRSGNLSWMDPPRHQHLRGFVRSVFTRGYMASLGPLVRATVEEVLRHASTTDDVAFVEQVARPVVSIIIAKTVGIPEGDHHQFAEWTTALMALIDPASAENALGAVVSGTRQMQTYLHEYVADRRARPGDDLTSLLTGMEIDGAVLSDAEIAGLIALLMTTGQAPTQLLVNAVICLDQHPAAASRLRDDPDLVGSFIDETMRHRAQTTRLHRFTMEDVAIGEYQIPFGRSVTVWLPAADRDPRRFPDPDRFDMDRSPNPHLGFGHGIHFCLGAPLGLLETAVTLQRLLDMSTAVSVDYERSRFLDPRLVFGAAELKLRVEWGRPNGRPGL